MSGQKLDKGGAGGILWAVRYARGGTPYPGSVRACLTEELEGALDALERSPEGITAAGLAEALLGGLRPGYSGDPGRVAENEVVRDGFTTGIPMIHRMQQMVTEAWAAEYDARQAGDERKAAIARGRVRGLAQALAFVRSPTQWEHEPRKRAAMVKKAEGTGPVPTGR